MPGPKKLFIDYSKCIGCETCEAVCKFVHDIPRIQMTRTLDGVMMPLYCRHCEDARCARACDRSAIVRDKDGALILQTMICRGCETRNCLMACPYAGIFTTDRGTMVVKCDLCAARRAVGLEPACVQMCPCGAVLFIDEDMFEQMETPESEKAMQKVMAHIRPKVRRSG